MCVWNISVCIVVYWEKSFILHHFFSSFHLHRQNTVAVSPNDIVITSVEQTDDGLQVTFYVRGGSGDTSGVINVDVVEEAVRVSITRLYIYEKDIPSCVWK